MNKKNILIILGFVILGTLFATTLFALYELQNDFIIMNNFIGYTIHLLSIKNYENGQDAFDLTELVVGKEKGYCEAVQGFWNEETRECLHIHEKHCRLITGSMTLDEQTGKLGNCILK